MHLEHGDRLLVSEREGTGAGYVCRVVSTWGAGGEPPFVVLRYDTGHEELLVPNDDLDLRLLTHAPA